MMNQVYKTLPDDRPITALCVVEDLEKCPKGYVPVSRTHDQDTDADLWRDSGFFGKKCTRYLCLSKTEGAADYVVQSIAVINEKDVPPKGYSSLPRTIDSAQKAWRKRQLCFKYAHVSTTTTAITDIIVLSRMKKAPEEFSLSGEINGLTLCYKVGKSTSINGVQVNHNSLLDYSNISNGLSPGSHGNANASPNSLLNHSYLNIGSASGGTSGNYVENGISSGGADVTSPLVPRRPAPKPPTSYATISGYSGLEGVPFILNPKWNFSDDNSKADLPKPKTRTEIDHEYSYEFRTERET